MGKSGTERDPFALVAIVGLVAVVLVLTACSTSSELPELEQRAQSINRVVMCPVCPGESIDQSQNPLALQMRDIVVEKLDQGWSNGDIYDFFVERYGPRVLLEPPTSGVNLAVWIVPLIGVIAGAALLFFVMRLMMRSSGERPGDTEPEIALTDEERERYFGRIEAALTADGPATDSADRDDEDEGVR
jgi:cytochrome c-type biogenesis protein CcmH